MGNDAQHKMHGRNTVRTAVLVRAAVSVVLDATVVVVVVVVAHVGYSAGIIKYRTSFASCFRFIRIPSVFARLSRLPTCRKMRESVYLPPQFSKDLSHYPNSDVRDILEAGVSVAKRLFANSFFHLFDLIHFITALTIISN